MEFLKERVFTALNADELKIGSQVICANDLESLKCKVLAEEDVIKLKRVFDESHERRFQTEFRGAWPLVYLISEPEFNWIAYLCRRKGVKPYLTACRSDAWEEVQKEYNVKVKLFEGTEEETGDWYNARRQFAGIIAAWEDGKTIQYNSGHGWEDCCDNKPAWDVTSEYRIKQEGLKWTDLKVGDVIWKESHTCPYMVIGMDYREESKSHILIGDTWLDDDDLNYWEKVE